LEIPEFRVIDVEGNVISGAEKYADIPKDLANAMLKNMLKSHTFDEVFLQEQSLGNISFYMQNSGEEAAHVGSAAALSPEDWIFT
jgi:2-oxoisovalerate dehydrogenase E1 component alpha subunit